MNLTGRMVVGLQYAASPAHAQDQHLVGFLQMIGQCGGLVIEIGQAGTVTFVMGDRAGCIAVGKQAKLWRRLRSVAEAESRCQTQRDQRTLHQRHQPQRAGVLFQNPGAADLQGLV